MFNLRLKLFHGKLKSKWYGPFEMVRMTAHGSIELIDKEKGNIYLVNGQRVKYYWGEDEDDREHHGDFLKSDFEWIHVAMLSQALHMRQPMIVMLYYRLFIWKKMR